jgi:putative toxin-antitoxin system antitoxin component (TIGR02293 family)
VSYPGDVKDTTEIVASSVEKKIVAKSPAESKINEPPTDQIESVMELAACVFEDQEVAKDWLNEPNLATDNKPPIALLGTKDGLLRVETLLHRIEYGVLA